MQGGQGSPGGSDPRKLLDPEGEDTSEAVSRAEGLQSRDVWYPGRPGPHPGCWRSQPRRRERGK